MQIVDQIATGAGRLGEQVIVVRVKNCFAIGGEREKNGADSTGADAKRVTTLTGPAYSADGYALAATGGGSATARTAVLPTRRIPCLSCDRYTFTGSAQR